MCWIGTIKDKKVAQEDITVYKVFYPSSGGIISPFQMMPYRRNTIYETEFGIVKEFNESITISKGFHSYETLKIAQDSTWFSFFWDFPVIYKCIIPKGSIYYINSEMVVVSNKIIVTNEDCKW